MFATAPALAQTYGQSIYGDKDYDGAAGFNVTQDIDGSINYIFTPGDLIRAINDQSASTGNGTTWSTGISLRSGTIVPKMVINKNSNPLSLQVVSKGLTAIANNFDQADASSIAVGISNTSGKEIEIGKNLEISVISASGDATAQSGLASSEAGAYGIDIYDGGSISLGNELKIQMQSSSGKTVGDQSQSLASGYGIKAKGSNVVAGDLLTITGSSLAGTAFEENTGAYSYAYAEIMGVSSEDKAIVSVGEGAQITLSSLAGTAVSAGEALAYTRAYGVNVVDSKASFKTGLAITNSATGGYAKSSNAFADAIAENYGILNFTSSNFQAEGETHIQINAAGGEAISENSASQAYAAGYGLKNSGDSTINMGQSNSIKVDVQGGTAEAFTTADASATAFGLQGTFGNSGNYISIDGDMKILLNAVGGLANGTSAYTNADLYGVFTDSKQIFTVAGNLELEGYAIAGSTGNASSNAFSSATATGLYLVGQDTQTTIKGKTKMNFVAEAKEVMGIRVAEAKATSMGVFSKSKELAFADTLSIDINSVAGKSSTASGNGTKADASAFSAAIFNSEGVITLNGHSNFNVFAVAGEAIASDGTAVSDAKAYGISANGKDAKITLKGTTKIVLSASGGSAYGNNVSADAEAYGVYVNDKANVDFTGNLDILAQAVAGDTNGQAANALPYALFALGEGAININQTGTDTVKLTGNIDTDTTGLINLKLNNSSSYWRPVGKGDIIGSFGLGNFSMGNGAAIDLAYLYSPLARNYNNNILTVTGNATFSDGAVFLVNTDVQNSRSDQIIFNDTVSAQGTQYIKTVYDPVVSTLAGGVKTTIMASPDIKVLEFNGGALTNEVTGMESTMVTPLYNYKVEPLIKYDTTSGIAYITGLQVDGGAGGGMTPNENRFSETPKTVADAQLALRNVWSDELNNMMRRLGDLRLGESFAQNGFWVRNFGGNLKGGSDFKRSFSQKYYGMQIGYDKKFRYKKGNYYLGMFFNNVNSSPHYERGNGKAKNTGAGVYASFLNDKGHYFDFVIRASKLSNKFSFTDELFSKVNADYDTWAYGLSAEYGYRGKLKNDVFYEPQIELSLGRIRSSSFTTSNNLFINQSGIETARARMGILVGKYFGRDNNSNVYLRTSIANQFGSAGKINVQYGNLSDKIKAFDTRDTYFELNLGANVRLSKKSDVYFEFSKSFGNDIKVDWQLNAGLRINF